LPSDKKEEVLDEYFFDHLKDDVSEEDHGDGKGCNTFNKFNAESDNHFVDPVCDILAESNVEGPKQSIMMQLSKKQVVKKTTSDVPMSLRKSPPETLIDQSTTQNILLMLPNTNLPTTLVASSAKKAVDIQSSSKKESEEQRFFPSSQRQQQRWRLCLRKMLSIFNHHHLKNQRLIPNLMPSMRPI
jgi:hypothetical protein